MNKTKLISILRSFSKSEIDKFSWFVRAFYPRGNGKILKLLKEIIKYYPGFENEKFTKEHLFKKVYDQKKYNDSTIRKLISYLGVAAEDYLIYQSVRKDTFAGNLYLLRELSSRNLDDVFEKEAAFFEKVSKNYPRDIAYYHNRFKLLNTINSYYAIRKRSKAVDNYQNEADAFFHYFLIEALNIYIYLVNEKEISNRDFKLVLFNEVTEHLKHSSYPDISAISIYYNCLMVLLTEEEKYFNALREIQKKLDRKTQNNELNVSYIILQNYCVSKVKKGFTKYKHAAFDLQKEIISNGLHLSGDRIHIFTFLNIVSEAVSVGETSWAENFIKENRKLLDPEYEFDAVNLSYAKCEFSRKQYEKALVRLGKINMEYSHFKLSVRTLILMIYYELNSFDSAVSMLDSYKHFLARDKLLPKSDRQNRLEFARQFKELLNFKSKMADKSDVNFVRTAVSANDNLIEKEWFLEKLEELEK